MSLKQVSPQFSEEALQRFLDTGDLSLLEKPLLFQKTPKYNNYLCCKGQLACWPSSFITAICCPVATFAPCIMFKHHDLTLDKDSVRISSAVNDCCCHVATTQKTVPLEKIQDVELQTNCLLSCYGLKQVNVQTSAQGTEGAEVAAAFLAAPERVRDAIQLAVRAQRQAALAPPAQANMSRAGAGAAGGATLQQRLTTLDALVARGVLRPAEAGALRVPVMAAEQDLTARLVEAAELVERELITPAEFEQLKAGLVAHITRQGQAQA